MSLIALASVKHSPGVTTAALALAAALSSQRCDPLVVEADPAGGDLAARLSLPFDPGLVSLAAAGRHGGATASQVRYHCQRVTEIGSVLVGPGSADQTAAALAGLAGGFFAELGAMERLCIVDCGRFTPGTPTEHALWAADVPLVVTRPTVEGVVHLRSRIDALRAAATNDLGVLLVGEQPYSATEIEEVIGVPVVGVLADDPRGADMLYRSTRPGFAGRLFLSRSARSFLERVLPAVAVPERVGT